jgi:hypothetical protein
MTTVAVEQWLILSYGSRVSPEYSGFISHKTTNSTDMFAARLGAVGCTRDDLAPFGHV